MKTVRIIFIFIGCIFLVFCSAKKNETPLSDETNTYVRFQSDYNPFSYIFDTLSIKNKEICMDTLKNRTDPIILRYFGQYSNVIDGDSIFEILVACRIDSVTDRNLLPLYVYILKEESTHTDGYVSEFISDMYFSLFERFPGYFYQYLDYLQKIDYFETRGILQNLTFEFYARSISNQESDSIFQEHEKYMKDNVPLIHVVKEYIETHRAAFNE